MSFTYKRGETSGEGPPLIAELTIEAKNKCVCSRVKNRIQIIFFLLPSYPKERQIVVTISSKKNILVLSLVFPQIYVKKFPEREIRRGV